LRADVGAFCAEGVGILHDAGVSEAAVEKQVDELECTGATTGIVDRTTIATNAREIIMCPPDDGM
jgi:hypothetical protein